MLEFISSFDWVMIAFIVILVISTLLGFAAGLFRSLFRFLIIVGGIVAGIFLAKWLGGLLYNSEVGHWISEGTYNHLAAKVSVALSAPLDSAVGSSMLKGSTQMTRETYLQVLANESVMNQAYDQMGLAQACRSFATDYANNYATNLEAASLVAFVAPFNDLLVRAICIAIGFIGSYTAVGAFFGIAFWVLTLIIHKKKELYSHIVGAFIGLVLGAAICWAVALAINVSCMMTSGFADSLLAGMKVADPNYWSISKWAVSTDLGYTFVLKFLLQI